MDVLIQVSVGVEGKPLVSHRFRVDHIYGTLNKAADVDQVVRDALYAGLRRVFGASVTIEGRVSEPTPRRGRPRKAGNDVPASR